jgi:hypothetical protein
MTEDLREVFARAADLLPDVPGRTEAVLARRRRRQQRQALVAAVASVLVLSGVVASVAGSLRTSGRAVTSATGPAAPGDCAHGGAPLALDPFPLVPLLPPTRGPDGSFAQTNTIRLTLFQDCRTVRVGQPVTFRLAASTDAATPYRNTLTVEGKTTDPVAYCAMQGSTAPATPTPGTYQETFLHTYATAMTDVVTVGVTSMCSPFLGSATAMATVEVLAAAASPQDPLALVGRWHVDGPGIADGTDLILGDTLLLFQACGVQEGSWKAEGVDGLLVGHVDGGDQGCYLPTRVESAWLDRARSFVVDGATRQLLDVAGAVVATLRPGATPTAGPNRLPEAADEPTISPSQRAAAHDPVALPDGVRAPTLAELERHFVPAVDRSGKAFVAFDAAGRWHGSDGCNGSGGAFAFGSGGRLLATSGLSTLIGCSGSPADGWVSQASRVGLSDGNLVFYDAEAKELGRVRPG